MQDNTKVKIGYYLPISAIFAILFISIIVLSDINTQIQYAFDNEVEIIAKANDALDIINEQVKTWLYLGLEDDPIQAKMFHEQLFQLRYTNNDIFRELDEKIRTKTDNQLLSTSYIYQMRFRKATNDLESNFEDSKRQAFRDIATDEYYECQKQYLDSIRIISDSSQKRLSMQRNDISARVSKNRVVITIAGIIGIIFAMLLLFSNSRSAMLLFVVLASIIVTISLYAITTLSKIDTQMAKAIESDLVKVLKANDTLNAINDQVKMWLLIGIEDNPTRRKMFYDQYTQLNAKIDGLYRDLDKKTNNISEKNLLKDASDVQAQIKIIVADLDKHYSSSSWQAFRVIATDKYYHTQRLYRNAVKKIEENHLYHLRLQGNVISETSKQSKVLIITISIVGSIIAFIFAVTSIYSLENLTIGTTSNTTSRGVSGSAFICPYCYSTHKISESRLKCSCNSGGSFAQRCPSNILKEYNGWIPQRNNSMCLRCDKAAVDIYCPAFIDKRIPSEYIQMKSLRIALLGAKAVGKSNYIGVLIEEIRNTMSTAFKCSLSLAFTKESQDAYDQYYYRPLYKDGHTVQATDAGVQIPPLIFPLLFIDDKYKITEKTALTFYDTAGENLNDTNSMHIFNGYIANAQGIILLLDPLQVPEIRDKLTAKGFIGLPEQNTETARVLDVVIKVITSVKNIKDQINTPLAIVLTKIDVLEQYDILPQNSCFRKESEHLDHGEFITTDFENSHIQMEALIDNWVQSSLMSYIKRFRHYAFFGVSALGANPAGTRLGGKVNPRRVLDPLLWLLAKEKYIKRK